MINLPNHYQFNKNKTKQNYILKRLFILYFVKSFIQFKYLKSNNYIFGAKYFFSSEIDSIFNVTKINKNNY